MTFSKLWAMQLTAGKRCDDRQSLTASMQRDKNQFMRIRQRNVAVTLVVLVLVAPLQAEDRSKEQTRVKDLRALVAHPEPEYPDAALDQLLEGDGVFRVGFDAATGVATSVTVEKSTGHALLDDAGKKALMRWRCKPRELSTITVPFSFRLTDPEGRSYVEKMRAARRFATYSPMPTTPTGLWRSYYRGGYGVYRMIVDPNTGRVVEVKVVDTSSSARIDDAAIKAFRQWRFRPHTVTSVTIPARL